VSEDPGDPQNLGDEVRLLRRVPLRHIERDRETNTWKRLADGTLRIKPQAFDDSSDGSAMTTWIATDVTVEDLLTDAGDEADFCAIVSFTAGEARSIGQIPRHDDPDQPAHIGIVGLKNKTEQKKFLAFIKVDHEPNKPPPVQP
jgi:hypothetical protein